MSVSTSVHKTQEFADLAFKRIREYGILPTPENYELWFVYFSQSNPEVLKAVDAFLDRDKQLNDDQCYEIYQQFLSGSREEKTVEQAGSQIQKTIQDVNNAVVKAKKNALKYNENLKNTKEGLSKAKSLEEANPIIDNVSQETGKMINQHEHLELMLQNSARAMEDMRRDLEIARKEALTDSLTGLSNRKAFDQEIRKLLTLTNKSRDPHTFSMILMDIDHFKSFNDNFGHQIGDQVLKLVARTLKEGVKGRDVVVRFGGEEFAVLLPETNIQGGMKIAEILRQEVEKKEVINRSTGKKIAKITLSGGVAQYFKNEDMEDFIHRVDRALYDAKNGGRNLIVTAKPSI